MSILIYYKAKHCYFGILTNKHGILYVIHTPYHKRGSTRFICSYKILGITLLFRRHTGKYHTLVFFQFQQSFHLSKSHSSKALMFSSANHECKPSRQLYIFPTIFTWVLYVSQIYKDHYEQFIKWFGVKLSTQQLKDCS